MTKLPVSLDDVKAAQQRICDRIVLTPMLESPLLHKALGVRVLVKFEGAQKSGAFKFRGAMNNILQLTEQEKRRGVFAMSAGNHAQGLALAAQMMGIPATILMPHDAPEIKVVNTRAYGAEVIFYNRDTEDREEVGRRIASERGLRLIHSYNDPRTIAGQGTIGLEIHQQCKELGVNPDAILINCSGGGLASGASMACELYEMPPQVYTIEPEGFDDARRSLESGGISVNNKLSGSICDALMMPKLGDLTFPILQHNKVLGLTASDAMVQVAMSVLVDYLKIVAEPGGCVSLAAVINQREKFKGKTVVVVVSGSNIASADFAEHIKAGVAHRKLIGLAL